MNGRRHHPNGSLLLACLTALSFLCVDCAEWFITGVRFLMKLQHERTKPYYSATLCIHIMFALITQSSHLLACASAPPNSFHLARQTIMVQYVCVCVCLRFPHRCLILFVPLRLLLLACTLRCINNTPNWSLHELCFCYYYYYCCHRQCVTWQ